MGYSPGHLGFRRFLKLVATFYPMKSWAKAYYLNQTGACLAPHLTVERKDASSRERLWNREGVRQSRGDEGEEGKGEPAVLGTLAQRQAGLLFINYEVRGDERRSSCWHGK